MEYNSEVVKLTQKDKKLQWLFMFFVWFKACEYNGIFTSTAVKTLIKFMVEIGWQKKRAAQEILNFFKEQGMNDNELIELWNFIMEKK